MILSLKCKKDGFYLDGRAIGTSIKLAVLDNRHIYYRTLESKNVIVRLGVLVRVLGRYAEIEVSQSSDLNLGGEYQIGIESKTVGSFTYSKPTITRFLGYIHEGLPSVVVREWGNRQTYKHLV